MKPPIETESGHTEQQQMHGPKLGELELCAVSPVQTRKGLLYAAVGLGLLLTNLSTAGDAEPLWDQREPRDD